MCLKTQEKHYFYLKTVLKFLGKEPGEITLEDTDRWKYEAAVNREYEKETVEHSFLILRRFLRFVGNDATADKMRIPKHPKHPPPEKEIWLLPDEQAALIRKSQEMGIRTEAMVRLFLSSGIRAGEMASLDLSDVDLEELTLKIRCGKGNKSRTVFFDTDTKTVLLEYVKVRKSALDGSNPLFTSQMATRISYAVINQVVKECAVLAGIKKTITPHKLRHTFITRVIETTKDIPLAQKLAGHDDISTTMRYHHTTAEEIKHKYRELLDSPTARDVCQKPLKREELLALLDARYLRNEIPLEVYQKLRAEYEMRMPPAASIGCSEPTTDPAYR